MRYTDWKGAGMYPTNEVRLASIIERHHDRAEHRRAISAAEAPAPARIGRWITLGSRSARSQPVAPIAPSS